MRDAAGHWIHDLSPFAIHLGGDIGIRWYGLAYLAGIVGGMWLLTRWARQGRLPLRPAEVQDLAMWAGLGMIIGGRVGYCLLYGWHDLVANPVGRFVDGHFEWPYLLRVWEGGMASHGGMAGLAIGAWLYARRRACDVLALADGIAAVAPLGVLCGRLANFVNGELWGKPWDGPWAVVFPHAPLIGGVQVARHPSQLYAAALEGALLLACILPLHARHRRPGFTAGCLLAGYAVVRIVGEIYREPDVGQPVFFGFISKGQAYSLPVFAIGVALALWAWRRGTRPAAYAVPT